MQRAATAACKAGPAPPLSICPEHPGRALRLAAAVQMQRVGVGSRLEGDAERHARLYNMLADFGEHELVLRWGGLGLFTIPEPFMMLVASLWPAAGLSNPDRPHKPHILCMSHAHLLTCAEHAHTARLHAAACTRMCWGCATSMWGCSAPPPCWATWWVCGATASSAGRLLLG